LLLPLLE